MMARWKTVLCAGCTLAALIAAGPTAVASSYYTARDLGPGWVSTPTVDDQGRSLLKNYATGETVPFPTSRWDESSQPLSDILPKEHRTDGEGNAVDVSMNVSASNALGTVVGLYPPGSVGSKRYPGSAYFTLRQLPDGSYGTPQFLYGVWPNGSWDFSLNGRDQLLYGGDKILDLDTNAVTLLSDLIAPELADQETGYSNMTGLRLADDGSILVGARKIGGGETLLILSPPTTTPEPSTLVLLVAAGLGVAYRRMRR